MNIEITTETDAVVYFNTPNRNHKRYRLLLEPGADERAVYKKTRLTNVLAAEKLKAEKEKKIINCFAERAHG